MHIERTLKEKLLSAGKQFPVLAILGPRQSGKTTLARETFPHYEYVNLEELDTRQFALEDPKGFLEKYGGGPNCPGVIFDEIQNTPDLLSYLQVRVDRHRKEGFYLLMGSQNILLNHHINQTLAGRIAIQTLLPLSIEELALAQKLPHDLFTLLYQGAYPPLYARKIDPHDWHRAYVQTYVERDARQIKNINDLNLFQKFIKLCAGRIGQLLNLTSLSNDCGISVNTARSWISILEASYIIFLLLPHHKNFNKRLIKTPKLYFHDTGLACHLLGIETPEMLTSHYLRGGLFESLIISDLLKQRLNAGKNSNLYFWRDKSGLEIDCILEKGNDLIPIEIKSGQTIHSDFFDSLAAFSSLAQIKPSSGYVVYAGSEEQKREKGHAIGWRDLSEIKIL
jgi:hypothetical protein